MRAGFLISVVALVLSACSGSSSSDDSASGGGTSGDPAGTDASTTGTSGSSGSSGSSGASGTSGTSGAHPVDGGADAGDGGPGGRDLTPNKAAFFGASRCAAAGVKLCEDFESGTLDTSTWKVTGTAPVIDNVQHARGTKALHITQNGNGPSYIRETKTFPLTPNAYWGRMFVYFESLPAAPMPYAHWTFAAATGTVDKSEIRLSGQLQNGKNLFGVGTDNQSPTGTGDWTTSDNDPKNAPVAVPTKQWLCIEWQHSGATNETRFFWDATEHTSLATTSTKHGGIAMPWVLPQFTSLWVGWQEYQTSTEKFEMWVDEIAIDTARIGCVL